MSMQQKRTFMGKLYSLNLLKAKKLAACIAIIYGGYLFAKFMQKSYKSYLTKTSKFKPRIVIIGAGLSGICMAIKLKYELKYDNFIIYEMLSDVGGTWHANTYPGCCCDVAGHLYTYSFEPNPFAKRAYPTQTETLKYITDIVKKYDLYKYIQFNTQVVQCKYNSNTCKWTLTTRKQTQNTNSQVFESIEANFVVSAAGLLNVPKYPTAIGNINNFKGKIVHSAEWDHTYNFDNKKVALIGTGCSSLQVTPNLCKKYNMEYLHVYQRTPGHVFPKEHRNFSMFRQYLYYYFPFMLKLHRWQIYWLGELLFFPGLKKGSKTNQKLTDLCDKYRDMIVLDKELNAKMRPTNPFGAKRVLVEHGYYAAFQNKKAILITDKIECLTKNGIKAKNGKVREYDAVVFCTGYETQEFLLTFPEGVINENKGIKLEQDYEAYIGKTCIGYPNMFRIMGPGTGLGHTSMILIIENDCDYIKEIIERFIIENGKYKSIEVKKNVLKEYNNKMNQQMTKMVWTDENTKSWYKNENNRVAALFAWNTVYYWWINKKVNWNDYVIG
eukprot:138190_1